MNLKRAYIFFLSFFGLCVMFTSCYYLSYRHALNQFNKKAVERKEQLLAIEERTPAPVNPQPETLSVDTNPSITVLPTTKYILQIYNKKTGNMETQNLNPPGYLVGLTREGVEEYLNDYMKDLTLSEYNNGLVSYDLVRFSDEEITLRKIYDEDIVPFRFYVVVKDGYVVVYNSDLKSVYNYTHIAADTLPEEERIALSQGIYVNSIEELYSLLESYSS